MDPSTLTLLVIGVVMAAVSIFLLFNEKITNRLVARWMRNLPRYAWKSRFREIDALGYRPAFDDAKRTLDTLRAIGEPWWGSRRLQKKYASALHEAEHYIEQQLLGAAGIRLLIDEQLYGWMNIDKLTTLVRLVFENELVYSRETRVRASFSDLPSREGESYQAVVIKELERYVKSQRSKARRGSAVAAGNVHTCLIRFSSVYREQTGKNLRDLLPSNWSFILENVR